MGAAVVGYALLAFLFSGCLLVVQPHSGIDPAVLSLTQFGPALAVAMVVLAGGARVRALLPAAVRWSTVRIALVAVVSAGLTVGCLMLIVAAVGGLGLHGAVAVGGVPFVVFVGAQLIGAAGEELGWRGFMLPVLERRFGRTEAVFGTGVVWALWHVQAFAAGPLVGLAFLAAVLGFACVLGYLAVGNTVQRTVVGTVGHWLINVALYLAMGDDTLGSPQLYYYAGAAVLVGTVVALGRKTVVRTDRMNPQTVSRYASVRDEFWP
ncbi:CPBP family glutamic-type intramembrane protease [Nocardia sp. NPDC004722]